MDTNDALEAAHAFPAATIVPVHCEGWAHFSQNRADLETSFREIGLQGRLTTIDPGVPVDIEL
jgi:hypothetical protein